MTHQQPSVPTPPLMQSVWRPSPGAPFYASGEKVPNFVILHARLPGGVWLGIGATPLTDEQLAELTR